MHATMNVVPPVNPTQPHPQSDTMDKPCRHPRVQVVSRDEDAEYVECLRWALGKFGPGWLPSHRHYLVEKEEEERVRYSGGRATAAATVSAAMASASSAQRGPARPLSRDFARASSLTGITSDQLSGVACAMV